MRHLTRTNAARFAAMMMLVVAMTAGTTVATPDTADAAAGGGCNELSGRDTSNQFYQAWVCIHASGNGVYQTFERAGGMLCGEANYFSKFESRMWLLQTDSQGRRVPGTNWTKAHLTTVECSSAAKKTLPKITNHGFALWFHCGTFIDARGNRQDSGCTPIMSMP